MAETTVRRVRHVPRTSESDRKNAAAALQRALDRRDNGGATGHPLVSARLDLPGDAGVLLTGRISTATHPVL
ncbi:hypothetical protein ABZ299_34585, partial [Streptomyces sp. NPDC006184]